MKISKITLENFKSYRDSQTVEFAMGDKRFITILEGQMGHGKSNLLNAFYWCLFDQYWDSDKHELKVSPDPHTVYLFNKGVLKDKSKNGEHVEMNVQIEFFDDDENKYTVRRNQTGTFNNGTWKFQRESKLSLERRSSMDGTSKVFQDDQAISEIEEFFPPSLSNYFLFRGENRTELVQLQGKTKFQEALDELSKVAVFKRAVRHLEAIRDDFRRELAEEADDELKEEIRKTLQGKTDAQKVLDEFQEALSELEAIEQQRKEDYEYYRDRIRKNQETLELQVKVEKEEGEIKRLGAQLDFLLEERRKSLTRKWGGLLLKDLIKKIENRYQNAVNSGAYPPDIKQSVIDKILHDMRCICGRDIDKGSTEFDLINRLKEIGSYDHLIGEIESTMSDVTRIQNLMKLYPNEIKEQAKQERAIKSEIQDCNTRIKGWKKKIGDKDESLKELQDKQDNAKLEQEKTLQKINEMHDSIIQKSKEIDEFEKVLGEFEKKLKQNKLPAMKTSLAENALKEARELKRAYEKAIYNDLEKYTQEHWDIMVYDKLTYDKIELKPDEMYFEVYDKDGNPTRSIMNTGHSILLVLSFISALTRIAKETWQEEYPLVMDAPTSEIGESAIQSALNGFTKVFNQAIVILKDGTVSEEIPRELKSKVGKRYWIELDKNRQHSSIEPKELVYV